MDSKCRVLILDDDVDGADSLGTLLGLEGHEVRVCYGLSTCLKLPWPLSLRRVFWTSPCPKLTDLKYRNLFC